MLKHFSLRNLFFLLIFLFSTLSAFAQNPDFIPFAPAVNYQIGVYPYSVFCADLDGDEDLDLAVANQGSHNVSILKNNGDGTFQDAVNYGTGDYPVSVFCADLDGDGDLDLAVPHCFGNDNVSVLRNNGDGTFQDAVNYGAGDGTGSVFCADLDGDGDLDLAVANYNSNNVSILRNNGDGTFQDAVNYGAGDYPGSVFCADLDGDGDLDLAVANLTSFNVSILMNNGQGEFQDRVDYSVGYPRSVFCADLDGDGDLDLAVANDYSDNVSILKNNGDGSFQTKVDYGTGDYPVSVFCADLDGDGDQDLAVANEGSNNVSVLINNPQGIIGRVTEAGSGNPISGAIVKTTFRYTAMTNAQGYYYVRSIPPGYGYDVWAYAGGFTSDTVFDVTIPEKGTITINFSLSGSSYNGFELQNLPITPNPQISVIEKGGTFHRYYQLVDDELGHPVPGAYVIVSPTDSFITDDNGICDIKFSSNSIGNHEPGATESFQISEISISNIRYPIGNVIEFTAEVRDRVYSLGWENSKYAEIGISVLRTGFGVGSVVSLIESDNGHAGWDSLHLVRQNKTKVGAEFGIGSPFQTKIGPAKFKAEANVEVFGVVHKEDEYEFSYPNYSSIDALNMYILFADGNISAIDNVLVRLLGYIEEIYTGQNSLDNAYQADLVGFEVGRGASAEANFGLNTGSFGPKQIFLGVGGNVGAEFSGYTKMKFYNHMDKILYSLGLSGEAEASIWGGVHFPDYDHSLVTAELPLFVTPAGLGASGSVGIGAEFGSLFDKESGLPDMLSVQFNYNYSILNEEVEKSTTYSIAGSDLMQTIENQVNSFAGLTGIRNNDQDLGLANTSLTSPLVTIFNAAYDLQRNENGEASISYIRENSYLTTLLSFGVDLDVGTAGIEAKVGGDISFKKICTYDTLRGVWLYGKHYTLEEYPRPSYEGMEYKELIEEICNKIPLEIRIAAFVMNILDLGPKKTAKKTAQGNSVFYITDSTGVDTTGYLTYTENSFPDTVSQVKCFTWGWWGTSPLSKRGNLSPEVLKSYQRIRTMAEESRGMAYGYGGFYQFQPYGLVLTDSAALTMRYLDSEIEGFSESELAMYREDKDTHSWIFVGGVIDTINNTVTAKIDQLGTYTLAPRLPYGTISMNPSSLKIPADGISTCIIESDTIYNNDSTVIYDSTEFTVLAEGVVFLTIDGDTTKPGLQVYSHNGIIAFEIEASSYAQVVNITAASTYGSAYGETQIVLADQGAPSAPSVIKAELIDSKTIKVVWASNSEIDIKGYKVYFDTDASGPPYEGKASIYGHSSPVDVGNDTSHTLTGLSPNTTYYIAVTAYDVSGNESGYSGETSRFTDVKEIGSPALPTKYSISQNYPNPFNSQTRIDFALMRTSDVTIHIYNILGQRVRKLVDERLSAGYKTVTWDGKDNNGMDVSSGIYFYLIKTEDFVESKKMILVK